MDYRYDIGKLFSLAFGVPSPVYMVNPIGRQSSQPIVYENVQVIEEDEAVAISDFGTPVLFPITLKGTDYKVYDSKGKLTTQSYSDFVLPAATLVDFRRAKNIIRTNVLGNNGTVKEIFGFDDWQIRIRGLCLPEKNRSETDQKGQLLMWEQIAGSIEVEGDLFREKNIYAIAISEIEFQQIQGKPKVIPFEITAYSDEPLELVLHREGSPSP